MENKPKQPAAPPSEPGTPSNADNGAEHGIPPGIHDAEPTGLPDSGRHHSEVTPTKP